MNHLIKRKHVLLRTLISQIYQLQKQNSWKNLKNFKILNYLIKKLLDLVLNFQVNDLKRF